MLIWFLPVFLVFLMIGTAIGFYLQSVSFLMIMLFLMGTQSTFFGPLKYAILPDHLHKDELIGGNGLIEAATFLAILLAATFLLFAGAGCAFMMVLVLGLMK